MATTVTAGDWRLRKADPFLVRFIFGFNKPKNPVLGHELAGEIVAIGSKVTKYKVGDEVFGSTGFASGTYAEYIALPETALLIQKPDILSFEEAASIPIGALTAWHFINKANLKPGAKVLIHGASGSIGTAAIQLAKHFGAEVTAVCSTSNIDLVKSLGANHVIDYTVIDFADAKAEKYDVVFNTVGKTSYTLSKKVLRKGGVYLSSNAPLGDYAQSIWAKHKIVVGVAKEELAGLECITALIIAGKFKPVIDKSYPLEEIVTAHRYVERGHKKGNVAIAI
jgi:NADPH:quinone reductase-like Zn-dependent oxidoreductase